MSKLGSFLSYSQVTSEFFSSWNSCDLLKKNKISHWKNSVWRNSSFFVDTEILWTFHILLHLFEINTVPTETNLGKKWKVDFFLPINIVGNFPRSNYSGLFVLSLFKCNKLCRIKPKNKTILLGELGRKSHDIVPFSELNF